MQRPAPNRRNAIEQQAADYLAALLDAPDDSRRAEVARWIEADPAHAVAFARAEAAWDATARLTGAAELGDAPPVAPENRPEGGHRPPPLTRRRLLALGAVAASAAALGGAALFYRAGLVSTRIGEMRTIALPDGSQMRLNTDSEARLSFSRDQPLVRLLQGEAFFRVTPRADTPFVVDAAGAILRALDSAFNVRLRADLMELTVMQGVVAVRTAAGLMRAVGAGEAAFVRSRTLTVAPLEPAEIDQRLAWRNHMIELDGETLVQAVQEFNRYRSAPLIIGDSQIGGYRVGGRFDTNQADPFLAALEQNFPIRAVKGQDGSVLLLYRDDRPTTDAPGNESAPASGPEAS